VESAFPADTAAFAKALLLGDSSGLNYELDTAFKLSGIRHIIAVSGLHVSILFSLMYILAGKRKVLTALLGIPVLFLFAAVAGFSPSIVRACVMQVLMIVAMLLDKEYDPPTALSFAVLLMLAVNPSAVTSVSLQLSVGCMMGIFMFSQ
jgi:competence protein ComEC